MNAKFNFKKKEKNSGLYIYYDKENVIALYIFKSGWSNPQMYNCILEWGEYGDVDHHFYDAMKIEKVYGIKNFLRKEKLLAINKNHR
jgi:hypothetical protein